MGRARDRPNDQSLSLFLSRRNAHGDQTRSKRDTTRHEFPRERATPPFVTVFTLLWAFAKLTTLSRLGSI